MKPKHDSNFWPAYSDLMTSLFFIMLVLFVLSFFLFKNKEADFNNHDLLMIQKDKKHQEEIDSMQNKMDTLNMTVNQYKKISNIEAAIAKLANPDYFKYNTYCKRYELNVEIEFEFNEYEISEEFKSALIKAGRNLEEILNTIKSKDNIKYILVIEGRAGRYNSIEENEKRAGSTRSLSYARAKSLFDLWESNGIILNKNIVEIIIAGSGFFGQCRYSKNEEIKNRGFIIQILPKVGKLDQ